MFVSHRCQFVVFSDPLTSCAWLEKTLAPWADQQIAPARQRLGNTLFFNGMSPAEAEVAFDRSDLPFRNYTRIAVVQNPFRRMAQLYDRIAETDHFWRLRRKAGWPVPEFGTWLRSTKPNGKGAGLTYGPRWRRFGAWSADAWADGRVTHFVRAENADADLRHVFRQMGIVPLFSASESDGRPHRFHEMLRYDAATIDLIRQRYGADLQLYHGTSPNLRLVA